MQPVTADFLAALRGPHTSSIQLIARRDGVQVGGTLQVLSGQVTAEASRINSPRRSLSVELAPARGLWDTLAPAGTLLLAYRGVRFINGTIERVPLGVFDVDEQSLGYGPSGGLSFTAPDLWVRTQRARFETPRTTSGSALSAAVTLASEAVAAGQGTLGGDFTVTHRGSVWERDREEAINELARTAGAWIYCDTTGRVTTRTVPTLNDPPVWMVDASASGVMLDATRSRNRQRTYNVVVVSAGDTDGTAPFAPQTAADNDSTSDTYVGGAFGRVPYFYSSQLLTTTGQATAVANLMLRRVRGLAAQLDLTSVVNPALEPGDVIEVLLPARDGDTPLVERHIVDSVTIPLTADGTQSIQTRSTRPEGDVKPES